MEFIRGSLWVADAIIVVYFMIYCVTNLLLLAISALTVKRDLLMSQVFVDRHSIINHENSFAPLISLLVPAYNEDVTIVDSVNSLLRLQYPHYEIIMVNDGSKDNTVQVLKDAFKMIRSDVDYNPHLGTAKTRGFYRATIDLPKSVVRLVLVDKENGGKADAINAGINASQGTYVASMDADSLMIDQALTETVQPILDDPNRVVACGGQVALSNGCKVEDGRVIEVNLPSRWIARFQVVEYMRSFTQSRTALAQMNALLILSGVFAVFQRSSLIAAGGFLTKHMRSRIGHEYCGHGAETVCEDMEVVVRLHRYLIDHGLSARVVFLPYPTSWTEAPEIWKSLGKQRNRWYRGLLEVLWYHRKMMLRPRYGRIGMFSLPYQLLFEAAAPVIEGIGYLMIPLSWLVGILSFEALFTFIAFALAFNLFLSVGAVLVSLTTVQLRRGGPTQSLFNYRGPKNILIMVFAGLLSNLGYRQFLLYWQLRGLKDFLQGRKSWDKFARQGFAPVKK